jgi:hypothetical protein
MPFHQTSFKGQGIPFGFMAAIACFVLFSCSQALAWEQEKANRTGQNVQLPKMNLSIVFQP